MVGRVLITGTSRGLGLEFVRQYVQAGWRVYATCRSPERALELSRLAAQNRDTLSLHPLDVSEPRHIRALRQMLVGEPLDMLINNAGVMVPPLGHTEDGFELQFGTNHLGHFAFTVQLLPLLVATEGSRVVNVSSNAQDLGQLNLDDLQWTERPFKRIASYSASKIANMLFTLELQRRKTHLLVISVNLWFGHYWLHAVIMGT